MLDQRRECQGVRCEIDAGQILNLLLDDQLLAEGLGFGRICLGQVAVDDLDRVGADLVAIEREVRVDPGFDVFCPEVRRDPRAAQSRRS